MLRLLFLSLLVTLSLGDVVRMDCYPEPGSTQQGCQARGCIWNPAAQGVPWCYLDAGNIGYIYTSQSGSVTTLRKNGGPPNPWGQDLNTIYLSTGNIGKTVNVKIYANGRYEPPVNFPRNPSSSADSLSVAQKTGSNPFSFTVNRQSTGRTLFDTSVGGLIFSDQFLQIATYLPSENMYGWGENIHKQIKHDFSGYNTWGMFARDEPPDSGDLDTKNLYGVHPFYMIIEPDGLAHGVLILNSNAQDVITTPGPALIYRTIGGNLDMYFFPGPTPEEVTQQYLALIGTPFLPAYWALGFQLSRYGYQNLDEMKQKIQRNRDAGIPLDTGVADIDYMNRYKDFSVGDNWNGFGDYVNQMHSMNMKLILIFDPAIEADYPTFQRGISSGARFIEWERMDQVMHNINDQYPMVSGTKIMLGVVWPDKHVGFPDFFDSTNNTLNWWINEFKQFHSQVAFDGAWIDMNEPSNFGTNDPHPWYYDSSDHPNDLPLFCPMDNSPDAQWDMPPYKTSNVWRYLPNAYLASKTLCLNAVQANGQMRFYNSKNLYGWSEARATQQAVYGATGKRGTVISRSTFPSSGRYAGHWLGDNTARWEDLQTSVIGAQEFNMFGIPYVGSDICGFIGTSNEELCLRWQQMGAFHSFMRNHNTLGAPPQDPANWPTVAAAAKKANLFRYKYMPYLFSLHFSASLNGGTVVRPVFYEFPHDSETYTLSYQFLWGKAMLIAPVVTQGATNVKVYLPQATWYSLFDNNYGQTQSVGFSTVPAPWTSQIPTFVRGGNILPRQAPMVTTTDTRNSPFELLVAPDSNGNANGTLFWDDGDAVITSFSSHKYNKYDFTYSSSSSGASIKIANTVQQASGFTIPTLDTFEIFNYGYTPNFKSFNLNGNPININVQTSSYSAITKILTINTKGLINMNQPGTPSNTLTWSNSGSMIEESDVHIPRPARATSKDKYELF